MSVGRRGFMAALGLGAAAAPVAGQMLVREAGGSIGGLMPGSGATMAANYAGEKMLADGASKVAPWTRRGITETIWNLWNKEADDAQQAVRRYAEMNIQGHDPVVFACKSWSPSFGVSYTYNKLKRMQREAEDLRERLWK